MECPNCQQIVETGAGFCGNCGAKLQGQADAAAYAMPVQALQASENKAIMSVSLGVLGISGSIFMALAGLVFGVAGLVFGTLARSGQNRRLSTAGIVLSSLAVVSGTAVWTYAVSHDNSAKKSQAAAESSQAVVANDLSTPCYSFRFADKLNIKHSGDSCDMQAFNSGTLATSTEAYKVYSSKSSVTSATSFSDLAKQAIEKDVRANMPDYDINAERVGAFAGSPDFVVLASNKSSGVSVVEAAVYHQGKGADNVFVLFHAVAGKTTDLSALEEQWQWR